jgi:hypothetical protein
MMSFPFRPALLGILAMLFAYSRYFKGGQRVKGTLAQNYASGIPPTSDVTLNNPAAVTDGDYWANSGSEYASTTSGLHYVQFDLGGQVPGG